MKKVQVCISFGANSVHAFIGGGFFNCIIGTYGTIIASGSNNYIPVGSGHGGIFSGQCNFYSGDWGAISGGLCNSLISSRSFIGGGECNSVSGAYSAVLGGSGNTVSAAYSYAGIFGQNVNAVMSNAFHVEELVLQNIPIDTTATGTAAYAGLPIGALYSTCNVTGFKNKTLYIK